MENKYIKKINVHYYLLAGILLIPLGFIIFTINLFGSAWINIVPGHSAPVIAGLVLIGMGILLLIAWVKNIKKGIRRVSS